MASTESWTAPEYMGSEPDFPLIRADYSIGRGGWVVTYLRTNLSSHLCTSIFRRSPRSMPFVCGSHWDKRMRFRVIFYTCHLNVNLRKIMISWNLPDFLSICITVLIYSALSTAMPQMQCRVKVSRPVAIRHIFSNKCMNRSWYNMSSSENVTILTSELNP